MASKFCGQCETKSDVLAVFCGNCGERKGLEVKSTETIEKPTNSTKGFEDYFEEKSRDRNLFLKTKQRNTTVEGTTSKNAKRLESTVNYINIGIIRLNENRELVLLLIKT